MQRPAPLQRVGSAKCDQLLLLLLLAARIIRLGLAVRRSRARLRYGQSSWALCFHNFATTAVNSW